MNANYKPLTPEDFGLVSSDLIEIVTGAQTFLPPVPDPDDEEKFQPVPSVDLDESSP